MRELREGEFLEVITLDKSLEDDDYVEWLERQYVHRRDVLHPSDANDSWTYYKNRRLINVISHRKSLIHYYGCVEKRVKLVK